MDNHVYKKLELIGTSEVSSDDAIRNAITKASSSLKHLRWFEVVETRGSLKDGIVFQWQVTIKLGFTLED